MTQIPHSNNRKEVEYLLCTDGTSSLTNCLVPNQIKQIFQSIWQAPVLRHFAEEYFVILYFPSLVAVWYFCHYCHKLVI